MGRSTGPRPRILVLLAAYNGVAFLDSQLRSILDQEAVEVRVLVSVDASDDGTEALVDRWVARDDRVSALSHGQRFGGAAANFHRLFAAADLRGCDAVALSDQDDVWYADKLIRAVRALGSHHAVGYSSNVLAWYPDGRRRLVREASPQRSLDHLFQSAGPGCTYVVVAEEFDRFREWCADHREEIGQLDYHDWLLYAWVRTRQLTWYIDPSPSMDYRQHAANQLGASTGWRALAKRARLVRSGWYSHQVLTLATALDSDDEPVVRRIADRRLRSRLLAAASVRRLRRSPTEQVALAVLLLLESLPTLPGEARGAS